MKIVADILIILHLIGMAYLFGAFLVEIKDIVKGQGRILRGILDGALLQLITGILLVGIYSAGLIEGEKTNDIVVGIKLVIALAVYVLAFMNRNKVPTKSVVLWIIGALTVVNVILGVTSVMQ